MLTDSGLFFTGDLGQTLADATGTGNADYVASTNQIDLGPGTEDGQEFLLRAAPHYLFLNVLFTNARNGPAHVYKVHLLNSDDEIPDNANPSTFATGSRLIATLAPATAVGVTGDSKHAIVLNNGEAANDDTIDLRTFRRYLRCVLEYNAPTSAQHGVTWQAFIATDRLADPNITRVTTADGTDTLRKLVDGNFYDTTFTQ